MPLDATASLLAARLRFPLFHHGSIIALRRRRQPNSDSGAIDHGHRSSSLAVSTFSPFVILAVSGHYTHTEQTRSLSVRDPFTHGKYSTPVVPSLPSPCSLVRLTREASGWRVPTIHHDRGEDDDNGISHYQGTCRKATKQQAGMDHGRSCPADPIGVQLPRKEDSKLMTLEVNRVGERPWFLLCLPQASSPLSTANRLLLSPSWAALWEEGVGRYSPLHLTCMSSLREPASWRAWGAPWGSCVPVRRWMQPASCFANLLWAAGPANQLRAIR